MFLCPVGAGQATLHWQLVAQCCGQLSLTRCCWIRPWFTINLSSYTHKYSDCISELFSWSTVLLALSTITCLYCKNCLHTHFVAPQKCCPPYAEWLLWKADLSPGTLCSLLGLPRGWQACVQCEVLHNQPWQHLAPWHPGPASLAVLKHSPVFSYLYVFGHNVLCAYKGHPRNLLPICPWGLHSSPYPQEAV